MKHVLLEIDPVNWRVRAGLAYINRYDIFHTMQQQLLFFFFCSTHFSMDAHFWTKFWETKNKTVALKDKIKQIFAAY